MCTYTLVEVLRVLFYNKYYMEQLPRFSSGDEAISYAGDFQLRHLHDKDVIEDFRSIVQPACSFFEGDDKLMAALEGFRGEDASRSYSERVQSMLHMIQETLEGQENNLSEFWRRVRQTDAWQVLQSEMRWCEVWKVYFDDEFAPTMLAISEDGTVREMKLSDEDVSLEDSDGKIEPVIKRRMLRQTQTDIGNVHEVYFHYIRDADGESSRLAEPYTHDGLTIVQLPDERGLSPDELAVALERMNKVEAKQPNIETTNPADYTTLLSNLPICIYNDQIDHVQWLGRSIKPVTDLLMSR